MIRTRIGVALLVFLVSCFTASPHSKESFLSDPELKPTLSKRASFDLNCSQDQLSFVPLGADAYPYKTVGVSGCGRKVVYIRDWGDWVLNSDETRKKNSKSNSSTKTENASSPPLDQAQDDLKQGPPTSMVRADLNCSEGEISYIGGLGVEDQVLVRTLEACGKRAHYDWKDGQWQQGEYTKDFGPPQE